MKLTVRHLTKYSTDIVIDFDSAEIRNGSIIKEIAEMKNGKAYVPTETIEQFILAARDMFCNEEKTFVDFLFWQIDNMLDSSERNELINKLKQ
jgi:hypothetical protein